MDIFTIISAAFGIITGLIAIGISVMSFSRSRKRDNKDEGVKDGAMLIEIGYIKSGIDDLKRDNRDINIKHANLSDRVIRCEESDKQICKRLDRIECINDSEIKY